MRSSASFPLLAVGLGVIIIVMLLVMLLIIIILRLLLLLTIIVFIALVLSFVFVFVTIVLPFFLHCGLLLLSSRSHSYCDHYPEHYSSSAFYSGFFFLSLP